MSESEEKACDAREADRLRYIIEQIEMSDSPRTPADREELWEAQNKLADVRKKIAARACK